MIPTGEIEEEFRHVRNNIVQDYTENKIDEKDLIEKLKLVKEMEAEVIEMIASIRKLSTQRE